MGKVTFRFLEREQAEAVLPQMFDILYTNMSRIAPTGDSYEDDRRTWTAYMRAAAQSGQRVILMEVDGTLAGYFQYRLEGDTLLVEEIEIVPEYQRTLLFYRFFRYAVNIIPKEIAYVEAYIDKSNANSMTIAQKLGMQVAGENSTGRSWRYRGEAGDFRARLRVSRSKPSDRSLPMKIIAYEDKYRDDMIFMVLEAKNALGRVPRLNEDLLDVRGNYLARGDMFWLAVDDSGRVIGCIGYNRCAPDTARLHRLYVKCTLKRQGIGSKLLRTAEQHLRAAGYRYATVHLGGKEYFESRQFYPKHGYVEYEPGYMRKEL